MGEELALMVKYIRFCYKSSTKVASMVSYCIVAYSTIVKLSRKKMWSCRNRKEAWLFCT